MAESSAVVLRVSDWAAADAAWRSSLARGVCGITEFGVFPRDCIVLLEALQCGISYTPLHLALESPQGRATIIA